ncbi:Hypothetical predicted protein [Mytilus galloprovincialis]|uniref:Reverse transcriptase domain-containing protein n=1 Tax=Mytilus galloprovincialis TaxID=29158 RepID=A0A8B6DQQ2_MYTGA|nr:Hypothetical predicted protein [Mytilus galloprovincialis]
MFSTYCQKIEEIRLTLNEKKSLHILGLCETFLNPELGDNLIEVNGYDTIRKDRHETQDKTGGGVLVYINNLMAYERRKDLEIGNVESIWLQINFPSTKPILLCSVYRPPDMKVDWIDAFELEISKASSLDLEIIIIWAKNPKELWKYVKGLNQTKSSPFPSQLKTHNGVITETQHIVDAFNKHFINIAPKDSLSTSQSYKFDSNKIYEEVAAKVPQDTWFYIPLITVAEVKDSLSNLNVAKATGIDQISPRILKLSSEVISPSIAYIINRSITAGIFPSELKNARVMPSHKKGPKDTVDNYRPISILPTMSKIFEKHVCKHLYRYLLKYKAAISSFMQVSLDLEATTLVILLY